MPDATLEPYCIEFPCFWFTAVMRYCGVGEQAYLYAIEAMWTMQDPNHRGDRTLLNAYRRVAVAVGLAVIGSACRDKMPD